MWGGSDCGVGGMQAFLSLFPNIPACSRLNIFTCCCWNTQVHGQTEAQRARPALRPWGDGPYYGLACSQLPGTKYHVVISFLHPTSFRLSSLFFFFFFSSFFHHLSLFSPYVSWQQLFSTHSPVGFVVFMSLRKSMCDLRKTQELFVRLLHPKQVGR